MKHLALIVLASASTVAGHGYIMAINMDGNTYPGYNPWVDRMGAKRIVWGFPSQNTGGIGPVTDVTSQDVTCRANPTKPGMTAKARAGSAVSFKWSNWLPSHKGPVITYMGRYPDNNPNAKPQEISMFKIHEDSYDPKTRIWGTDTMMKNNMTASGAIIPSDIKPGKYILRHELVALHFGQGNNPNGGGAELYPECMDVEVISSSGNAVPEGVKFPGAYKATDAGIKYNLYVGPNQYFSPGPTVYRPANPQPPVGPAPTVQTGYANPAGAMANTIQDSIIGVFNTIFPGTTQAGVFKWDVPKSGVSPAKAAASTKAPTSITGPVTVPNVEGTTEAPPPRTAGGPATSNWLRNWLARLNRPGQSQGERVGIMATILSKLGYGTQGKPAQVRDAREEYKRHLMIKGRIVH